MERLRRIIGLLDRIDDQIPLVTLVLFVGAIIAIGPWGDFPTNDDWQYARAALKLFQSGHFVVDTEIAPAIVGQTYFVQPFIALFGFSHTLLRVLVLLLAPVTLIAIDRLLALADVGRWPRRFATLLLAFNPIFMNLANSYMSELPGYAPALWGAYLWLRGRKHAEADPARPAISMGVALLVALLIGACFWTRQFVASVFPALLGATVANLAMDRRWAALKQIAPTLIFSIVVFALTIKSYFWWAAGTGNLSNAFSTPVTHLLRFDLMTWRVEPGIFLLYMAAFFLPLLVINVDRMVGWWPLVLAAVLVFGVYSTERLLWVFVGRSFPVLHRSLPFVGNLLFNAGVGPLNMPGVYEMNMPRPAWPQADVKALQTILTGCVALWGGPIVRAASQLSRRKIAGIPRELLIFALLLTLGSLALALQAYRLETFDRYYLPCLFGMSLALALLYREVNWTLIRVPIFVLLCLPMAWFAVAGVHDYFRWNEARWELGNHLLNDGISSSNIDGGYEWNGWVNYDSWQRGIAPTECIGRCRPGHWFIRDDSYRIGMSPVFGGYEIIASQMPNYWLKKGPAVIVSRRLDPFREP